MLLEMQNVVKRFGGLTAVSNMSFQVEKGEIFGVIGPNGAGKTTIFNLITGVYPVSEGNILFDGQSISGKKPYQIINGGIARTFQNIRLFTGMTVLENILVGQPDHLKAGFLASILHTGAQKKEEKEKIEAKLGKIGRQIVEFLQRNEPIIEGVDFFKIGNQKYKITIKKE